MGCISEPYGWQDKGFWERNIKPRYLPFIYLNIFMFLPLVTPCMRWDWVKPDETRCYCCLCLSFCFHDQYILQAERLEVNFLYYPHRGIQSLHCIHPNTHTVPSFSISCTLGSVAFHWRLLAINFSFSSTLCCPGLKGELGSVPIPICPYSYV